MKFLKASFCFTFFVIFSTVRTSGATKCYECFYDCQTLVNVTCNDNKNDDFLCFSTKFPLGGKDMNVKGCILADDQEFKANCKALNEFDNNSCYVCDNNFCNLL
ncbi:uncharacterized protein LOC123004369 [Tribolium madens]|uniref:uncharacterized protein LOC123004369 n=1 Tax=Tribolium madens TaxID=41895 RepID=UPI001CF721F8|nr:uncharacterized protein LOC123004369 [Tribolium madens]